MATSQLLVDAKKFDKMIVDVITDLRRKHKRADCKNIHKEFVKIADFSNIGKEDLMNRINILLIDEKILNKRNRNLDSYYVNENTSPDNNNFSETSHDTSADDTEPIFPVTLQTPSKFASPDGQSSNIDTIYEKIKIQNFKDNILQFMRICEDLIKKSSAGNNKIIGQLQDELKSKDHIINSILTTIGDLTSSELKSKDKENTTKTSINQSSTKITSDNTQSINDSDKNNSINAIKEQVVTIKDNSASVKPEKIIIHVGTNDISNNTKYLR